MYVDNRGRWCDPGTTASAGKNRAMFRASPSGCSGFCALDRSSHGAAALMSFGEECQLWSVARRGRAKTLFPYPYAGAAKVGSD